MMDHRDDSLIDDLWRDLDGQVSRQRIASAVGEIAASFETATVTAFIPIFIHRRALELLRRAPSGESHLATSAARTDGDRASS
jgi:hypothetical protein